MFDDPTLASMLVFLVVSVWTCGLGSFLLVKAFGSKRQAVLRLRKLGSEHDFAPAEPTPRRTAPWAIVTAIGSLVLHGREDRRAGLKNRLLQAGFFGPLALPSFVGIKLFLMFVLWVVGVLGPCLCGVSWRWAALSAVLAGAIGLLAPEGWLRVHVRNRQALLASAIPDALDMLVLCLEGGVSFTAAFQRVTDELNVIHPLLGAEMNIVQREIELGLTAGEALTHFGERCALAEVRDLASIIRQSEFSGASVAKALRTHADCSRLERQERATEMAQKAAVKILFPTLIFIFPAIFIVLLGPAAFQIAGMFKR
jgi:tight adherence protein C